MLFKKKYNEIGSFTLISAFTLTLIIILFLVCIDIMHHLYTRNSMRNYADQLVLHYMIQGFDSKIEHPHGYIVTPSIGKEAGELSIVKKINVLNPLNLFDTVIVSTKNIVSTKQQEVVADHSLLLFVYTNIGTIRDNKKLDAVYRDNELADIFHNFVFHTKYLEPFLRKHLGIHDSVDINQAIKEKARKENRVYFSYVKKKTNRERYNIGAKRMFEEFLQADLTDWNALVPKFKEKAANKTSRKYFEREFETCYWETPYYSIPRHKSTKNSSISLDYDDLNKPKVMQLMNFRPIADFHMSENILEQAPDQYAASYIYKTFFLNQDIRPSVRDVTALSLDIRVFSCSADEINSKGGKLSVISKDMTNALHAIASTEKLMKNYPDVKISLMINKEYQTLIENSSDDIYNRLQRIKNTTFIPQKDGHLNEHLKRALEHFENIKGGNKTIIMINTTTEGPSKAMCNKIAKQGIRLVMYNVLDEDQFVFFKRHIDTKWLNRLIDYSEEELKSYCPYAIQRMVRHDISDNTPLDRNAYCMCAPTVIISTNGKQAFAEKFQSVLHTIIKSKIIKVY